MKPNPSIKEQIDAVLEDALTYLKLNPDLDIEAMTDIRDGATEAIEALYLDFAIEELEKVRRVDDMDDNDEHIEIEIYLVNRIAQLKALRESQRTKLRGEK